MFRYGLLFALLSGVAHAAVPTTASHQGRLLNPAGDPLEGTVDLRISLWDAASGGSEVWSESFSQVRVSDGFYSVILGNDDALDESVLDGPRWLQIRVDDASPLTRQPLSSTPFALVSRGVDGGVVNASEIRVNDAVVIDSDGQLSADALPGGAVPTGAVMFFDLPSCPSGWSMLSSAMGRTVVGGTPGTSVGSALAPGGQRRITDIPAHRHAVDPGAVSTSSTGAHAHSVNPPSTSSAAVSNHTHTTDPASVNTSNTGNHAHVVDPANVATTSDSHNHSYQDIYWSEVGGPVTLGRPHVGSDEGFDSDNASWEFTRTTGTDTHNHTVNIPATNTTTTGAHAHSVNIPATTSSAAGGHAHAVDIAPFDSASAGAHSHSIDIPAFDSASAGSASVDVTMPYLQLLPCRRN